MLEKIKRTLVNWCIRDHVQHICFLLEEDWEEWSLEEHKLSYNKNYVLKIWISSGWFFYRLYDTPGDFSFFERLYLRGYIERAKNKILMNKIIGSTATELYTATVIRKKIKYY